jgi:hypothetical protein
LAGTATFTVALTFTFPSPVPEVALKNFTGLGAVVAAGTARFVFDTVFAGAVQVEPVAHAPETPAIVDAVVGNVCPWPSLNVVEVIVRFQPAPLPVASVTVTGSVYGVVWSAPFSVTEKLGEPPAATLTAAPDATVELTPTVAARAVAARQRARTSATRAERID